MSTLKTINIVHPSGSPNNIVSDASGNVTVGNNLTVTGTLTGSTGVMNIGSGQIYKDASGNVGIGTATPLARLQVVGGVGSTGGTVVSTGAAITMYYDTSNDYGVTSTLSNGVAWKPYYIRSAGMVFKTTSDVEAARFDTGGNLLVGTTSNNGVVTSFTSSNTGRAGFFMVNAASSLAADAVGISKADNNTTTSQVFVKFFINNNTAASGLITANGANQAAFTSSSDARLKENITPLDPQLEKICSLNPCEFDYKDGTGRQIGFIAQEVMEIYPDLVGESADGMLTLSDMSKNDARLIKAIQELKAQNDELKARVAALESAQ